MANCPLLTAEDVLASYRHFVASAANTQISVTEYGWLNPWWAMTSDEHNVLNPVFNEQIESEADLMTGMPDRCDLVGQGERTTDTWNILRSELYRVGYPLGAGRGYRY